jgi:hypothetical protein
MKCASGTTCSAGASTSRNDDRTADDRTVALRLHRKMFRGHGAEVVEIETGRINEIRDYYLKNSLMSVAVADACGNFVTPRPSSMRRKVFWC